MYFWSFPDWYDATPFHWCTTDDASTERTDQPLTVDQRLTREVAQALLSDPAVTSGLVDLRVHNGVAILDGTIDSEDARAAAVATAESVSGIRDVCNALVLD
ncbi:BON domain-containing protein [Paractinoplanes hotanensis]|uniref:BON domain-containing protein n=1 Tax=Paractinoplanes hotanensis TaxID=2906497 RepID=A0ABT0YCP3_9ACTN|nr:BON domain-containing protein [Actinoplanes hotanensis]MCM4083828.1 BON domain-containing protein [Actinoplanes hotanensis]